MSGVYHLSLAVSDILVSKKFYKNLLVPLGWEITYEDDEALGISDGSFSLWIIPAENPDTKHTFHAVGFHHLAIRVDDRNTVDKAYKYCQTQGIEVVDAPAEYPEYQDEYYAVFLLDPDGMKLEIVSLD